MSAISLVAMVLRALCVESSVYVDLDDRVVLVCDGREIVADDAGVVLDEPAEPLK